ncbi:TPA: hypothetical protein ACIBH9_004701 [Salmonella enterica subsp. diarizonae serovar 61:l,v:z35]
MEKKQSPAERFYESIYYSDESLEEDYLAELRNFSSDHWDTALRAARLSAAVKRFKTSEMLRFILEFVVPEGAQENGPDLTPLAAKRLCNALFGRSGSQSILVYVFGHTGRVHRSASCFPKTIEGIADQYRPDAERYWNASLATIERVKHTYRAKIRNS